MVRYFRFVFFLMALTLPLLSFATTTNESHVKISLVSEEKTVQPGTPFWVALHVNIEDDWHVYWKNPGDAGMPLQLKWSLPEGFKADDLQWPFPEKFTLEDLVGFGYQNDVIFLTRITPPELLESGTELQLNGNVNWLVCSSETCQPGSAPVQLAVKIDSATPETDDKTAEIFKKARANMPKLKVQVKTIQKEGVLQLQFPTDSVKDSVTGVYFFPEEQNVIDSSVDPVMGINESKSNGYLVNLKGGEEIGVKIKNLKGVLVVHTEEKGTQAYDIDSPIQENSADGVLTYLDIEEENKVFSQTSIGNSSLVAKPQSFEGGLGLALLFAFMGGMLLNLMPCVLPVMSFKVMSFVKMAGQSRAMTIKHGLLFSFGVILSFWVLASVMLALRTYGQAVGWGFQLQEPLFVVILASLLFIFSLSLFGTFEWGLGMASWAGQTESDKLQKTSGNTASFFSGVMATAVATPCTGPFLGSAIGFAVTLPVFQSLLIFTVLGLGMCFPYLLLAAFPSFLRFLPKPGAWMETFKQLMGFLLLATVLWLLWVFSAQTNSTSLIFLLAGFLCFSIGAWLYGIGTTPMISKSKRLIAYAAVAIMAVAGCELILIPRATWYSDSTVSQNQPNDWAGWETFSPERVAQLEKAGTPYIIDFTAKWCLICQANHMVLTGADVGRQLDDAGVVRLKADWTKSDPVITEALSKYGRNSVPLYVFSSGDAKKEPVILPQVLTPDSILDHVKLLNSDVAINK
ncbi:MAG: thioredoxin family protein [Parachlamydiaceae bacterium]|nr:thioredoxin family protein [Parachlamydiaceae bacterium]